jgi:hypothetical protein
VTLVLIAMQKIASSSVAAIRTALRKRLATLEGELKHYEAEDGSRLDAEALADEDDDLLAAWDRWSWESRFKLMADELPHLRALLDRATAIDEESKVRRIAEIIDDRYADRSVLLFTEYKATQALMVSMLMAGFGEDLVGFINGEDRLSGVRLPSGNETVLTGRREATADAFNAGRLRFLAAIAIRETAASGRGDAVAGEPGNREQARVETAVNTP